MNKKAILILSLIASAVLLTSMWITVVQSARKLQIPTEWYQTIPSVIIEEHWNWDWTPYPPPPPGVPSLLYKRVGDTVFFTLPGADIPVLVAHRIGQSLTWVWRGAATAIGGPGGNQFLMVNGTISITFTNEDIPLTDEDNDYKGLRLLIEEWVDLYRLENLSGDDYLWRGFVHQHFVAWAPKGSRA